GELFELAAPEQVQAAVADVSDSDARAVGEHADDRRSHPAVVVVALCGAENAPVGEMDGRAQPGAVVGQIPIEAVRPGEIRSCGRAPDEPADRFDGES